MTQSTAIENKEEAISRFKSRVQQYGLQWTSAVPPEAYKELQECNKFLDANDRREALGFTQHKGATR